MDIIDYLPQKMKAEAKAYMPCGLEEIRVRAGKQVQYMFAGGCRAGVYISHSDIEEMIKLAKIYLDKWDMQYIFLTSDTEEAVQAFKKTFKDKLIVLKRKRFSELLKKGEINNLYSQGNLYQTSLNYLTEMILLSRCDCLIGSINSGLRYAVIQNNCKYKNVKILNYGLL